MFSVCYPNLAVSSVVELTPERLGKLGVSCLLLDVDCTLKRYGRAEMESEIADWFEAVRAAGIRVCLVSNGVGRRIGAFAARYNVPFVAKACKPFAGGCRRAMRENGFAPKTTAIVGDQIFADVMAGRRAGILAILTTPVHPEEEHFFTRIKRPFEKIVLRRFWKNFPDGVWKADKTR